MPSECDEYKGSQSLKTEKGLFRTKAESSEISKYLEKLEAPDVELFASHLANQIPIYIA